MKTFATGLFIFLAFWAGALEVQKNPQRYSMFTTMGPK